MINDNKAFNLSNWLRYTIAKLAWKIQTDNIALMQHFFAFNLSFQVIFSLIFLQQNNKTLQFRLIYANFGIEITPPLSFRNVVLKAKKLSIEYQRVGF